MLKPLPSRPILDSGTDKSTLKAFISVHTLLNQLVKRAGEGGVVAAHKDQHKTGGADALTAADIGAAGAAHTHGENVGEVKVFARKTAPDKFLRCNGQTIGGGASGATARADADTQALFEVLWGDWDNGVLPIQDSAGAASTRGTSAAADFGANKRLPLPDLRGEFVRGWDEGRGVDSGRVFGSGQGDAFRSHTHAVMDAEIVPDGGHRLSWGNNYDPLDSSSQSGAAGGAETRPRNVALLYCIRYAG